MAQALTVRITATDDASAVFEAVASSAEAAGSSIESAGAGAETFGQAMETASSSAESAGAGIESAASSAETAGAAMEAAGSGAESAGSALESAGGSADVAGSAFESVGGSADAAGSSMESISSSADAVGSALESAGGHAESAGSSLESAASSAESAGAAMEAAGSGAQTAGSALESAASGAESAGSSIESAASSAESAGSAFEGAASSAESAGSGIESAGSSAESAGSAFESAGGSAESAGAAFESVGGSAESAGGALESAGASAESVASSLSNAGASADSAASSFDTLGGALNSISTRGLAAVGMTTGLVAGLTGVARSAWDQVDATQQATTALSAYETQAGQVDQIQRRLLEFARSAESGGIFFTEELYAAAQGLVTYGAEMSRVTDYVEIMARAVGQGTANWEHLVQVLGRVGSTSRLTGQDFQLLSTMGYQLDESLRNTNITWDELFDNLSRGIPADVLEGQVNTIRGAMAWLEGAVRDVGAAFLQVDRDTGTFIEGGLGDRLFNSISTATDALQGIVPAAEAAGSAITFLMDVGGSVAGAFQSLPDPIQTSALALAGLGVGLTTAGAALRVLTPAVVALGGAFRTLMFAGMTALPAQISALATGFRGLATSMAALGAGGAIRSLSTGLMGLLGRISPITAGLTALVAIGAPVISSWINQRQAAQDYEVSLESLEDTIERLRRVGEGDLAQMGESLADSFANATQVHEASRSLLEEWNNDAAAYRQAAVEAGDSAVEAQERWYAAISDLNYEASKEDLAELNDLIADVLSDPNIDHAAWFEWADGLREGATTGEELDAVLQQIFERSPSDFRLDGLTESLEEAKASADELDDLFADLPTRLDDLRISGDHQLANDIEELSQMFEEAFSPDALDTLYERGGLLSETLNITTSEAEALGEAWQRITQQMESGNLDNVALMDELRTIMNDPSLTDSQIAQGIIGINEELHVFANETEGAVNAIDALTAAQDMLGAGMEGVAAGLEEQRQLQEDLNNARMDFLADGSNILDWWLEYDAITRDVGEASFQLKDAMDFRETVEQVQELAQAAQGLDAMLYYFDQIEALGQRSSAAGAIADALFGPGGDPYDGIGPLRDIYEAGILGQTEFNDAVDAGIAIQESNANVQDHLNKIRADQLPLLAEQQAAYEEQIVAISQLEAGEQQKALAMMDSAMQAQIAEQYSRAYAAAVGDIPEEVATELIANAANADPILKELLEDMGLIEEGADGEVRVNFPDADTTINAIDRLTSAIITMDALGRGLEPYEVAVEIYGEDEARAFFSHLEGYQSTSTEIGLTVATEGIDAAQTALDAVQDRDITVPVDADTNPLSMQVPEALAGIQAIVPVEGDTGQLVVDVPEALAGTTVAVPVEGDTDELVVQVPAALEGHPVIARVDADTGELVTQLAAVGDDNTITVPVDGNTDWFSVELPNVAAGHTATVDLEGNPEPLITQLPNVGAGHTVMVDLELNVETAIETARASVLAGLDAAFGSTDQTITVTTELVDNASEPLGRMYDLANFIDGMAATVTAELTDNASSGIGEISSAHSALDGAASTLSLELTDNATAGMQDASSYHSGLNDNTSTFILNLTDNALGTMQDTAGYHSDLDGNTSTLNINADTSDASAGISWAQGYQGSILATSYIDIVTRRSSIDVNRGGNIRGQHGGVIPSYASGGVIAELAEAGPELVYYPDGDVGLATTRGLYDVAPGSYVSSAPGTRSRLSNGGSFEVAGAMGMGGVTVNVNVSGDVYGISDLTSKISDELVPVITEIFHDRHRGQGVN